jgi:dTDP-4-dehydrorhamnose reductase
MRIWMTGGTGFVGSNIVRTALANGHQVTTTVHSFWPGVSLPYAFDKVDMTDAAAVLRSIEAAQPDLLIHCAIVNDLAELYADRRGGWDGYVSSTRVIVKAAAAAGIPMVLVSTDWVFDGTQAGADEDTPPNPVNIYGFFKAASELVALEHGGAIARVSGVNGVHYARPNTPRQQDPGFGYFVASLVDSLRADNPFTVFIDPGINMVASPSLASDCADIILQIGAESQTGIFHCCGAEAVGRLELAHAACELFGLNASLIRTGPPEWGPGPRYLVPHDSSIVAPRTERLLRRKALPLETLLERFKDEYDTFVASAGSPETSTPESGTLSTGASS